MNITKEENTTTTHTMMQQLGLINLFSPLPKQHESREKGRIIDHCLIIPYILSSANVFGYLPYNKITMIDQSYLGH